MMPTNVNRAAVLATVAAVVTLAACSDDGGGDRSESTADEPATTTIAPGADCGDDLSRCTLREVADLAGVLVGAAVSAEQLEDDPAFAEAVATHFNSITPENDLKWPQLEPERGEVDFSAVDAIVDFAEEHDLAVRGHTLLWAEDTFYRTLPEWVTAITDPEELRTVVADHIREVVGRYAGRIDRWDVVNEPLLLAGADLDPNHLYTVLGPEYLADAFRVAAAADPAASLWLNEHSGELSAAKGDALVALVQDLLDQGVPIHGVGVQGHYLDGSAPGDGALAALVERLRALGVEVAITELDLPIVAAAEGDDDAGTTGQADAYAEVTAACLDAGCREITVWGVSDAATWVDDLLPDRAPTRPLLLDDAFAPKLAYDAVRDRIGTHAAGRDRADG